jgi:glycosyltransferase involved in cell wall biosynthesis
VSVVWVGEEIDPELAASVRKRLDSLRHSFRWRFVAETRSIRSVYLAVDCLALPSLWEGFPNVVLEALAHGVPVIATDVGDVRSIVEDGVSGWVVPPESAELLASAIIELIELPDQRRVEMGAKGAASVRDRYSADLLAARTMDVYRRVLGGGRGTS